MIFIVGAWVPSGFPAFSQDSQATRSKQHLSDLGVVVCSNNARKARESSGMVDREALAWASHHFWVSKPFKKTRVETRIGPAASGQGLGYQFLTKHWAMGIWPLHRCWKKLSANAANICKKGSGRFKVCLIHCNMCFCFNSVIGVLKQVL